MTVEEAHEFFAAVPAIARKLADAARRRAWATSTLGQSATTLSGGEAQRVKLSQELSKRDTGRTLYILDEPTTGLHFHDIDMLLEVLHRLRDHGNTVVVIEHNLDVIKTADWVVDLGPEGGDGGGRDHRAGHARGRGAGGRELHRPVPRRVAADGTAQEGRVRLMDTGAARELLRGSFGAAVAAADPLRIVPPHLPPPPRGRTVVVGAGKAAGAMAKAVDDHWPGDAPLAGLVITRYGHGMPTRRIRVVEAGHPVPDERGEAAAGEILALAAGLSPDDLLLVLVSGGGSSLLALPAGDIAMADLKAVTRELLASGAPIQDMNTVRKHLSAIQGGRLAAATPRGRARAGDLGRHRRRTHPHRLGAGGAGSVHLRAGAGDPRRASA